MKLVASFDKFLADHVNLNKTRIEIANDGLATVTNWLKANELFGPLFLATSPQGSIRQGTIIKPVDDQDFDVDVLFQLKRVQGWEPKDYLGKLHDEFKKTERYKDIVDKRGKTRCVTLDYESDFHIDIVPSVTSNGQSYVMNRSSNEYEATDGDGYAAWFAGRNAKTGGKHLVRVVRLVKHARHVAGWDIRSIVLTTVLAG